MKKGTLALIAGGGALPIEFLERAREKKENVVVAAIENEAGQAVCTKGFKVEWFNAGQFGSIKRFLAREKAGRVVTLGYVKHTALLSEIKPDLTAISLLARMKDKRASSIFGELFREFEKMGMEILPTTYLMERMLGGKGPAGKRRPTKPELKEAAFAMKMAASLAAADIGQTVVVKNGIVVSAEAQEGTDRCIERGGLIAGRGFVVAKASRKDLRYDVPVIGTNTIGLIKKYGGKGIIFEAGRTFLVDREKAAEAADRAGIYIYGTGVRK